MNIGTSSTTAAIINDHKDHIIPDDTKMKINNLLFETLPGNATIDDMDDLSYKIFKLIEDFCERK